MSILFLLQQCVIGLTNGSLIALVALGYTMVYGVLRFINFAHGDLIMLSACLALSLVGPMGLVSTGQPPSLGTWIGIYALVIFCGLFCGLLSMVVDRLVYQPLRNAPPLAPLVSAIGVSLIAMNIGLFWIGAPDRSFPQPLPSENLLRFQEIQFTWNDLLVVLVVMPLIALAMALIRLTRFGKALRAVSEDRTAAALIGVDVNKVIRATFFLSGFLGGAASVVTGLSANTISYQMGFQTGFLAITASVLGGLGSLRGAVIGSFTVGLVGALSTAYVGERWANAFVFIVLLIVLVFRPEGLLGQRAREVS